MLNTADRVIATHDIRGMYRAEAIRQGTSGVVIGHCGSDIRTYRVRFTVIGGRTAVLDDLTEYDIARC